jgi:hypothetical protein
MKEETSGCAYWIQTAGTAISSGLGNGGCREHLASLPALPVGEWSHLAAVFNNAANTYTIYLNGSPISSTAETGAPAASSQALVLGQSGCSGCGFERWRGLIDDVRIYKRALTTPSIQADMNTGL